MTDSTYTVPALLDQAEQLRRRADDIERKAAREADEFRKAANELEGIAREKKAERDAQQADGHGLNAGTCPVCQKPMVFTTGLGWQHADASVQCTPPALASADAAQQDGGPQE